mgnify:FL=1
MGLSSNSGASGASGAGSAGAGAGFSPWLLIPAWTGLSGFAGEGAEAGLIGFVGMPPPRIPPPVDGVGAGGVLIPDDTFGVRCAAGSVVVLLPRTPFVRFCVLRGD